MHPIQDQLRNPLRIEQDQRDLVRLRVHFADLSRAADSHHLALRRYLDSRPECFYSRDAFQLTRDWLWNRDHSDEGGLKTYLADHHSEISQALLYLREINAFDCHDGPISKSDEFEFVRLVDRHIHPAYLRLVEGVFATFLHMFAHFSRLDRKKGTEGLNICSIVEEARRGALASLVTHYQHTMRNAIAHGGVTFLQNDIQYQDKSGNAATLSTRDAVRTFDDLLDTCNGIAAALKLFTAVHRRKYTPTPRELLVEELQEASKTPWWNVEGCVAGMAGSRSQLILFARPDSRDYPKIQWSAIQSGILAEYFAPGFDRYFLSLHSPKAWRGWASFDGRQLNDVRRSGSTQLEDYCACLDDRLVFYVPQPFKLPRTLGRVDTMLASVRTRWPVSLDDLRRQLKLPRVVPRLARAQRNSWGAVVHGSVVLPDLSAGESVRVIRQHRRRLVRAIVSLAGEHAAHLPIAFAEIAVFRRDYRRRRLASYGLCADLICTVRLQRLNCIQSPDIIGSEIEVDGRWRIAWNRSWLEDTGVVLD